MYLWVGENFVVRVDLRAVLLRHKGLLLLLLSLEQRRIIHAKDIELKVVERCRSSHRAKALINSA